MGQSRELRAKHLIITASKILYCMHFREASGAKRQEVYTREFFYFIITTIRNVCVLSSQIPLVFSAQESAMNHTGSPCWSPEASPVWLQHILGMFPLASSPGGVSATAGEKVEEKVERQERVGRNKRMKCQQFYTDFPSVCSHLGRSPQPHAGLPRRSWPAFHMGLNLADPSCTKAERNLGEPQCSESGFQGRCFPLTLKSSVVFVD